MPRRWSWLLLLCVPLLHSCSFWQARIHPDFVQTFIDVSRRGDDSASAAIFDPELRVLAVGRESGRLELWDTTKPSARVVVQAQGARTQFIAFGAADGIVLTNSVFGATPLDPQHGTRIWDARTGKLIHGLQGMLSPGPVAASPVRGLYLTADTVNLMIYDHAKRAIVGEPLVLEDDAQVTAITSDVKSGLIAVGSSRGDLLLAKLVVTGSVPKLEVIRRATPYGKPSRLDVHALMLLDEGTRLVSIAQDEVVEWDTATLSRVRQFPTTLNGVHRASFTAGEPWLVLAGLESTRGRIELVDLRSGVAWRYKANTTHPTAVLFPEIRAGLILQSGGATRIRYLDQKD